LGKKKLQKTITNFRFGTNLKKIVVFITTYDTFKESELIEEIEKFDIPKMLIADEVHYAGASSYQQGLLEQYHYRLGLSATPQRYFDDVGTQVLLGYFKPLIQCKNCLEHGSVVFKMDLKEAIDRKFLSPYYYYPYYVDLTKEELQNYKEITRRIAVEKNKKPEEQDESKIQFLNNQRANILKNAENKMVIFEQILEERKIQRKNLDYCLIYCAPKLNRNYEQIKIAQKILNQIPIPNSIIKSGITSESERQKIIEQIESGLLKCALAIRILDEGIDIPPLKTAIILASDGNPKQFIQRRGRILRKWSGTYTDGSKKKFAEIYDIFVIPSLNQKLDPEFMKTEKKIVEKELKRHKEMVEISLKPEFGLAEIKKIEKIFGL